MNKEIERILILNSSGLNEKGVGSLFLNDLISDAENVSFDEVLIKPFLNQLLTRKNNLITKLGIVTLNKTHILHNLRLLYYVRTLVNKQVTDIQALLEKNNYKFIWIITSNPELIFMGKVLVEKGYNVRVTIWDDPHYLATNLKLNKLIKSKLLNDFGELLNKAESGMVISYKMQKEYKSKYDLNSIVVRHGIKKDLYKEKEVKVNNAINISFAGSLYCKKEWNLLIKALSSNDWKLNGKEVYIHHIGKLPKYGIKKHKRVKFYGWKPFNETLDILKTMDIGYLPYWFSKKYRVPAETSFPGKMSSYAIAGLAIFHHGPDYTEVTTFLKKYPFGVACNSQSIDEIINSLEELAKSFDSPDYLHSRSKAVEYELSNEANLKKFKAFLK